MLVAAVTAAASLSCSNADSGPEPRAGGTTPPRVVGGPGSCAEVPYGSIVPPPGAVGRGKSAPVGISIQAGSGAYVVTSVRVEVLPPGAPVTQEQGGNDPLASPHGNAVKRLERSSVPASNTQFVIDFDGTDGRGAPLAPGKYPVVFDLRSSGVGGCEGGARASGVLTTIDWRG